MKRLVDQQLWLVLVVPLVAGGIALFFLAILVTQGPKAVLEHLRWRYLLWASRRIGTVRGSIGQVPTGCLIVDSPSMCSAITHCWWTPDTISQLAPLQQPTEEERWSVFTDEASPNRAHTYDSYCYNKYLSAVSGTAILIAGRRGEELAVYLQLLYPDVHIARTWSAAVKVDRRVAAQKRNERMHRSGVGSSV